MPKYNPASGAVIISCDSVRVSEPSRKGCMGRREASQKRASCDPEEVTLADRTTAVLKGLCFVIAHHGASTEIQEELSRQLHLYLDRSSCELGWLKRVKHTLACQLATYLGNPTPKDPEGGPFRPTGPLRRWMRARLKVFSAKNSHLWFSWFQAKRSALPVSEGVVLEAYRSHREMLTRPDECDDETIEEIMSDPAFSAVLDVVSGQLKHHCVRDFRSYQPSTNAAYGVDGTRKQGGQQHVLQKTAGLPDSGPVAPGLFCPISDLFRMDFRPWGVGRCGRIVPNLVREVRHAPGYDEWETLGRHPWVHFNAPLAVQVQAVLEPCKIRLISKGEALPYYMAKPLQKGLHSVLRRMDCFRLIGQTFEPTMLNDLREKATEDCLWYSVDYSAATDGLSFAYSWAILERILSRMPPWFKLMASRVLGPQNLTYPVPEVSPALQTNGQLMGSVLSFPLLCLANLGVYLGVTRRWQEGWTVPERLRHVLINGDDMLYAAPGDLWDDHVALGQKVGLEMSVGKAYVHRTYANINSMSVHSDLSKRVTPGWLLAELPFDELERAPVRAIAPPRSIPFLNTGLFFGQNKVLSKDHAGEGLKEFGGAVAVMNTVLEGGWGPVGKRSLLKGFLAQHRDSIARECSASYSVGRALPVTFERNLFLPQSVGGMGVRPPEGWWFKVSGVQKAVGASLREEGWDYCAEGAIPEGFEELERAPLAVQAAPWSTDLVFEADPCQVRIRRSPFGWAKMCRKSLLLGQVRVVPAGTWRAEVRSLRFPACWALLRSLAL